MRIYIGHSIRGPKGADATHDDMEQNCRRIEVIAEALRGYFSDIDFYVPAEYEDFVGRAYEKHFLTEKQILEIDCDIISTCNAVIIYTPPDDSVVQGGRLVEMEYAHSISKQYCKFGSVSEAVKWLTEFRWENQ